MTKLREYLDKHPSETQRMLGIDYDQLIQLITNAENLYARQKETQEGQKTRLIKPGSGRPSKLTIADQSRYKHLEKAAIVTLNLTKISRR